MDDGTCNKIVAFIFREYKIVLIILIIDIENKKVGYSK